MPVFAVRGVDGRVGTSPPGTEWRQWNVSTSSPTSRIPIRELLDVMLLLDVDDDGEMALRRLGEKMEGSIRRYEQQVTRAMLRRRNVPSDYRKRH